MVISQKKELLLVGYDILALIVVYFLPAIAHLTVIPFQVIEPFRLMVLISLILLNDRHHALILSFSLPIFSFIVTGHPIFIKSLLISTELAFNVLLFSLLRDKIKNPFFTILCSIILSKLVYYLMKFFFISCHLLDMSVISTSILVQLMVAIITAVLFGLFQIKYANKS